MSVPITFEVFEKELEGKIVDVVDYHQNANGAVCGVILCVEGVILKIQNSGNLPLVFEMAH